MSKRKGKRYARPFRNSFEGRWYWRIKAANGRTFATGGQGFRRLETVQKMLRALQLEWPNLVILPPLRPRSE